MNIENLTIRDADWIEDNLAIKAIRTSVFINEQNIPCELEWDKEDTTAIHCLAFLNNSPVATCRLQTDGQLGRMSVLKDYRNRGIGQKLLSFMIDSYHKKFKTTLFIHAQKHAVKFYEKFNFVIHGNEFLEANIPHYLMTLKNEIQK